MEAPDDPTTPTTPPILPAGPADAAATLGGATPAPPVTALPSTHHSPRHGAPILAIVVHATAGTDSRAWLVRNPNAVSAHALIDKAGRVYRMVADDRAAHHAGFSRLPLPGADRWGTNQTTLGVELENRNDGRDPYPPAQLAALAWLIRDWRAQYGPLPLFRHGDIDTRGKTDPRGLSVAQIEALLAPARHPILGGPSVPATTLITYLDPRTPHLTWQQRESIVCAYTFLGAYTTIGNLLPFAQAVKEASDRDAAGVYRPFNSRRFRENRNPAGLGATNDGAKGAVFATIEAGIGAQYAHLLCYAARPDELPPELYRLSLSSPRRAALEGSFGLGCAPTWEELNGRWAYPGPTYGQDIVTIAQAIAALT